jgi:hypothetical protein
MTCCFLVALGIVAPALGAHRKMASSCAFSCLSGALTCDLALATCDVSVYTNVALIRMALLYDPQPAGWRFGLLQSTCKHLPQSAGRKHCSKLLPQAAWRSYCFLRWKHTSQRDHGPRIHISRIITWRMVATTLTSLPKVLLLL